MRTRWLGAALLAVALAAPFGTALAGQAKTGPFVVGFSEFTMAVTWRIQSNAEIKYSAQNNKDVKELIVTQAEGDVSKQIADVEDLIARKVDVIVINAGSPKALIPVIKKAVDAGIVVVDFDNTTDSPDAYHLTLDQEEFGRIGAEWLAKAMNGKGKIVVFNGVKGTSVSAGRFNGAEKVFKRHPGIEVLQVVFGGWDYAQAKRAMESLFAAYPQIDGVWSQGGNMSEAVIDAFMERGLKPPLITGEDANGFFHAWTRAKEKYPDFDSVATSCPPWMSSAAMELGIAILKGEKKDKINMIPNLTITKDTLQKYYKPDFPSGYYCDCHLPEDIAKSLFTR